MSVELLFLINQAADLSIIAAVSRGFGAFRLRRMWFSSTLCALYGVLAAVRPGLAAPGVQLGLLMPAAMLALGRASPALTVAQVYQQIAEKLEKNKTATTIKTSGKDSDVNIENTTKDKFSRKDLG